MTFNKRADLSNEQLIEGYSFLKRVEDHLESRFHKLADELEDVFKYREMLDVNLALSYESLFDILQVNETKNDCYISTFRKAISELESDLWKKGITPSNIDPFDKKK